ncbi:MAG TPA: type II asparaginase [Candidatus Margulisiibacteriota bacterium]|nr:type II asparaginase [Candidatus Margulisiibacteriota bacterium]
MALHMRRNVVMVTVALLLWASAAHAKPKIVILATGGTIAGAQASTTEAGYKSGSFSVDDLIKAVPPLKDVADISGEQVANIGSQTMNNEVWLRLAARVNAVLKGDVDGVVITHGTDTMEETAYFLSLVVKSDKPVVLVGSMRPATAISADGPANLYNAVALAANPEAKGRGPLVVLNDEIHYAHEAQKMNTTQLDTFKSPNRGRAGVMNTGKAYFFSENTTRHTTKSEFSVEGKEVKDLPRVEVVYSYANLGRETIDFLVEKGVKGIVLAGVGDGNSTDAAIAALADAAKKGVAVVRSSRTGSGLVVRNVEVDDDKLGFIAAMELSPQKARILLMLGLMKTQDPKALQKFFMEY